MALQQTLKWILSVLFTSFISGTGFYCLALALQYAKNYKRRSKEKTQMLEEYLIMKSSCQELVKSESQTAGPSAYTSRGASLFSAYKRSPAFLTGTANPRKTQETRSSSVQHRRMSSNNLVRIWTPELQTLHTSSSDFRYKSRQGPICACCNKVKPSVIRAEGGIPFGVDGTCYNYPAISSEVDPYNSCSNSSEDLFPTPGWQLGYEEASSQCEEVSPSDTKAITFHRGQPNSDPETSRVGNVGFDPQSPASICCSPVEDQEPKILDVDSNETTRHCFHMEMWNKIVRECPFIVPYLEPSFLEEVRKDFLYHNQEMTTKTDERQRISEKVVEKFEEFLQAKTPTPPSEKTAATRLKSKTVPKRGTKSKFPFKRSVSFSNSKFNLTKKGSSTRLLQHKSLSDDTIRRSKQTAVRSAKSEQHKSGQDAAKATKSSPVQKGSNSDPENTHSPVMNRSKQIGDNISYKMLYVKSKRKQNKDNGAKHVSWPNELGKTARSPDALNTGSKENANRDPATEEGREHPDEVQSSQGKGNITPGADVPADENAGMKPRVEDSPESGLDAEQFPILESPEKKAKGQTLHRKRRGIGTEDSETAGHAEKDDKLVFVKAKGKSVLTSKDRYTVLGKSHMNRINLARKKTTMRSDAGKRLCSSVLCLAKDGNPLLKDLAMLPNDEQAFSDTVQLNDVIKMQERLLAKAKKLKSFEMRPKGSDETKKSAKLVQKEAQLPSSKDKCIVQKRTVVDKGNILWKKTPNRNRVSGVSRTDSALGKQIDSSLEQEDKKIRSRSRYYITNQELQALPSKQVSGRMESSHGQSKISLTKSKKKETKHTTSQLHFAKELKQNISINIQAASTEKSKRSFDRKEETAIDEKDGGGETSCSAKTDNSKPILRKSLLDEVVLSLTERNRSFYSHADVTSTNVDLGIVPASVRPSGNVNINRGGSPKPTLRRRKKKSAIDSLCLPGASKREDKSMSPRKRKARSSTRKKTSQKDKAPAGVSSFGRQQEPSHDNCIVACRKKSTSQEKQRAQACPSDQSGMLIENSLFDEMKKQLQIFPASQSSSLENLSQDYFCYHQGAGSDVLSSNNIASLAINIVRSMAINVFAVDSEAAMGAGTGGMRE